MKQEILKRIDKGEDYRLGFDIDSDTYYITFENKDVIEIDQNFFYEL